MNLRCIAWKELNKTKIDRLNFHNNNNTKSLNHLLRKTQVQGVWPFDHPLPLPKWDEHVKESYRLKSVQEYEMLASEIEGFLQKLLEELNYNTVGNLLSMYKRYKKDGKDDLMQFFKSYSPPIKTNSLTCVGLALELWNRLHILDKRYPNLSSHIYVVSCEENIEELSQYIALGNHLEAASQTLEKEHVLMCLKFEIAESRNGVLLCDPGYHVGRAVTVMNDAVYPHTGWFIQSEEGKICKEYNYQFTLNNNNFVEWNERTTKGDIQENFTGLIHVSKAYLTAVDVTERRNLVYNFRSLLSRDQKGHLIAGVYFKIKENTEDLTVFFQDMGKQRLKMNFADILKPVIDANTLRSIQICNEQLNLPKNSLLKQLRQMGELLRDHSFLQQLLEINRQIGLISEDN